jgi:hypothetical protein
VRVQKIGRRFETVTGTMVESAAISDMEDPVRLLTNLHHQGGGGQQLRVRRGAVRTAASGLAWDAGLTAP